MKNQFIYVVQIAGWLQEGLSDLTENQLVKQERFALLDGSRLDVYLPKEFNIKINEGQTSISGETF